MEAEQLVSLSADKIIQLLRDEPGLLLQVKKLVRKAFEQGRLLDPADLNDEALFRLLREDEDVRILATQEIEDRSYIRPKPSKEELAQEAYRQMQRVPLRTQQNENQSPESSTDLQKTAQSQEENTGRAATIRKLLRAEFAGTRFLAISLPIFRMFWQAQPRILLVTLTDTDGVAADLL